MKLPIVGEGPHCGSALP